MSLNTDIKVNQKQQSMTTFKKGRTQTFSNINVELSDQNQSEGRFDQKLPNSPLSPKCIPLRQTRNLNIPHATQKIFDESPGNSSEIRLSSSPDSPQLAQSVLHQFDYKNVPSTSTKMHNMSPNQYRCGLGPKSSMKYDHN